MGLVERRERWWERGPSMGMQAPDASNGERQSGGCSESLLQ